MNKPIKAFFKCSAIAACLSTATLSHADMNTVMILVNDPSSAPIVKRCDGNVNCNAFVALSREWQLIPKGDRLRYFIYSGDLNAMIREGKDLKEQKLIDLDDFAYQVFDYHAENFNDRWLYIKGLAVLKYVQRTQFDPQ
ncbi:hypothetical protein GPS63_13440 [Acinetobacter haemolyticus]|uniref:Uncharacterized protein n=2 Tax=Acinetobacter TaxID=469 RepID=A0A150HN61_9GAMM|nr:MULTISPECIES: hypothetical protein [Acinetobacter]ENW21889.1 hypothetical protein F926_01183 [Acinetobacter haemolyticus NIPH 261]ENW96035.1 hypothetical protein F903_01804 [Acinetobacter sp. NIPH 298]KXZ67393.1 hypothetical protein AVENLUH5627_02194 [Acinetobacter venetianus]MDA3508432.1 hypothetical protein [Acinetobacter junii]MDA3532954.1 hypothetical protein [Acinetobacter junii]